jgi:hypothetical protein
MRTASETSPASPVNAHPDLSFLPFLKDNVAVSDCYNSLILCWCLGATRYRYVVYNLMTQKFNILPPNTHDVGHSVGEARLGFDPTASWHFYVIDMWMSMVCEQVWRSTHLKLQHGSRRNLNGVRRLM